MPLLRHFLLTFLVALTTVHAQPAREPHAYDDSLFKALRWRSIGPYRGGRVTTVAGVPGQPLVYYMGATGGGVWKTEDGGLSWNPMTDDFVKTGSVGAIAVAPSDPNVIYLGMGEADVRSNFSHGDGVYKSVDAGRTWKHIGLASSRQIGRIAIHPHDADVAFVAALGSPFSASRERGLFRTRDGGATWENVKFVDDTTGAVDVVIDPVNPRVVYASFWPMYRRPWGIHSGGEGSGPYKSVDGGTIWTELSNGLPTGMKGRIGLAVSPTRHDRVWAIVEAKDGGVFRSDNAGATWQRMNGDSSVRERAWYYSHIIADPKDEDTVYVLTLEINKSIDGGRTFQTVRAAHVDNHSLWLAPDDPQRMINGNDGGAAVSLNGGRSWTTQLNQPTGQFYHVITDSQFPYRIYGAQQDSTTVSIASRTSAGGIGTADWYDVGGGESGYIAPDPRDPNIVYAGTYYGVLTRYDHRLGETRNVSVWPETPGGRPASDVKYRFQWTFPIVISPVDPSAVYAAANVLFKSVDQGQSWQAISPDLTRNDKTKQGHNGGPLTGDNSSADYYCTIFTVAPSRQEKDTIWTGSDDGLVHVTRDAGKTWKNVTPKQMLEWTRVNIIEASPHAPGTAYVAATRYQSDDFKPYIYKTTDYGTSWTVLARGIPDTAFVRVVREDPVRQGLLYAGTETGVYVSFDAGARWQPLQLNLPFVPITDLAVQGSDLIASTQGRSFWVLDDLSSLRQMNERVATAAVHLFEPRDTYRVRTGGFGGGTAGAAGGKPIRTFRSRENPAGEGREERRAFLGPSAARFVVPAESGLNRFEWDMRYPDASPQPPGTNMFGASVRGPLAVPGKYHVRLVAAGKTLTQPFDIVKDPRTSTTPEDFDRQFALLKQIHDRVSETHDAIADILAVRADLKVVLARAAESPAGTTISKQGAALDASLASVQDELVQMNIREGNDVLTYPAKLNNLIGALAPVVAATDTAPTAQSYEVFKDLSARLDQQLARLDALMSGELAAFNKAVDDHHLIAIPRRMRNRAR
ncbi:MAG: glycosyl hydrolase [Acidobacteria bacterium]|nr:glycosyl hydrolase [Acidobacteriota bacterium]